MTQKKQLPAHFVQAPLPETAEDLIANSTHEIPLRDLVSVHFQALWSDPYFKSLHAAAVNGTSVEGLTQYDDAASAIMLRNRARETNDTRVSKALLHQIIHEVVILKRRWGIARSQLVVPGEGA